MNVIKTKGRFGAKIFVLLTAMAMSSAVAHDGGWQGATRESAKLAPSPDEERRAVIQGYAAPVWGWRGWFADHTWIAVKPQDADSYTVYEVIGWRLRQNGTAVRIANDVPDRHWFGGKPRLLTDIRGATAARLIPQVERAAKTYPYPNEYRAFPGPNSNTFIAWIGAAVPALNLNLPLRAVGKNYPAAW